MVTFLASTFPWLARLISNVTNWPTETGDAVTTNLVNARSKVCFVLIIAPSWSSSSSPNLPFPFTSLSSKYWSLSGLVSGYESISSCGLPLVSVASDISAKFKNSVSPEIGEFTFNVISTVVEEPAFNPSAGNPFPAVNVF